MLRRELDEPILSHVMMLSARVTAAETLLVMAWTNELAKQDDPLKAAEDLKDTVLGLIVHDTDDPIEEATYDWVEHNLDAIIHRVKSL